MIDGATEIISGIQGKYLDPLLLAQSQATSSIGLIVVAYNLATMDGTMSSSKFYDLLFLHGSSVVDCARISQDVRFRQQLDEALATFKSSGTDDGTRIYLYQPSEEEIERFRSTFYYEPSLKVQLESLSRKQMRKLLSTTRCKHGIVECSDFGQPVPNIRLQDIGSIDELVLFEPSSKQGQLILYDIDNNRQFVREQYPSNPFGVGYATPRIRDASKHSEVVVLRKHPAVSDGTRDDWQTDNTHAAEQFTHLVAEILKSSSPKESDATESRVPLVDESDVRKDSKPLSTRKAQLVEPGNVNTRLPVRTSNPNGQSTNSSNATGRARKGRSNERAPGGTQTQTENHNSTNDSNKDKPEFVRLFERIFRSFRQVAYECLGDRWDMMISQAENQSRLLVPELDLGSLNEETAPTVLNVIEFIATEAPLLKRSRLRNAALTLIADIYNKQYELLEQQNKIDLVEQIYFRLKR